MPRITIPKLRKLKGQDKIVMITAYDAPSARLADAAAEVLLVGDSVATTVQGRSDTLSVSMDEMIYHTQLVAENSERALVLGDMPFMSYQASKQQAVRNAGRFLKEGRAGAVKLEGGASVIPQVKAIIAAGISVCGHIGYTPQSVNATGVAVNRNRDALLDDAKRLEEAGVFALVLEMVPADIAMAITESVSMPTIGIGGGPHCDGQVLVFHDLLGFNPDFTPKFLKRYLNFAELAAKALGEFRDDVKGGAFPEEGHSY